MLDLAHEMALSSRSTELVAGQTWTALPFRVYLRSTIIHVYPKIEGLLWMLKVMMLCIHKHALKIIILENFLRSIWVDPNSLVWPDYPTWTKKDRKCKIHHAHTAQILRPDED